MLLILFVHLLQTKRQQSFHTKSCTFIYMVQVQEFHMTITDLHHMILEEVNHITTQCDGEILGPGHVTRYPSVVMVNINTTNQVSRSHD